MRGVNSIIIFFILISSYVILAQIPPVIDREVFFGDPEIAGSQISPDGNYISFLKPFNGVLNIWVKTVEQKFEDAHPLTADTARPIRGYFWSRDSKYILYVQDKGGDENFRIYKVDPAGKGEPVPTSTDLTPLEKVRAIIIDVPRNKPDEIIIGLNDRDPKLHDVYKLNLKSGERTLIRENKNNMAGWVTDTDGNLKLGIRIMPDGGTEILKLLKDTVESVYQVDNEETVSPVEFTPDGSSFYLLTNKGDDIDKTELLLFNLKNGKTNLIDKDPEDEVDLSNAIFSDITHKLLATVYIGDKQRIYPKDDQFAENYEKLKKAVPEGDYRLNSVSADEKKWIVSVSSDVDPGSTYLFNTETGAAEFLYKSRPELNNDYLAEMKPVSYKARDGMIIHGYLTLPKGIEAKNLPVVMFIHGGPWSRDYWGYNSYIQFLANRGYAVLQPNFRGSSGYGKKYLNSGNKEWGLAMQDDITDGARWLINQGIADPKKISIAGGSYGGYATLAGLAFTPDLYAAGFDIVGPSNIITLLKSIPPYWTPIKKMFDVRVGDMNNTDDLKLLQNVSPFNHAKAITAPLYVVQGANDPRVNKAESDQIVAALRDLGRDVEYMVAPDEGHGFAGLKNRMAMIVAMEKFLSKHIGGRLQEEVKPDILERLKSITVDIKSVKLPKRESESAALLSAFNGSAVKTGSTDLNVTINAAGQNIAMQLNSKIESGIWKDKKIYKIIDVSTGSMLAGSDTLIVDAATLLPIFRAARQGTVTVNLDFTDSSAAGLIEMGSQSIPVNIKYDTPSITEGTGAMLAIETLPLKEGYKAYYNEINLNKGSVDKKKIEVTGTEKIKIDAGEFDTYKINISPAEGGSGTTSLWIDKNLGIIVKMKTVLPQGNATVEAEIAKPSAGLD